MRSIDKKSIDGNLTVGYSYMLKAGLQIFETVRQIVPDPSRGEIAVLCGKGNNGGDGYVAARLLLESGYTVICISQYERDDLGGEALLACDEYVGRNGNVLLLSDTADLEILARSACIIDALLGTGIKGKPHSLTAHAIDAANRVGCPIVAADTPSGLNNDTGELYTPCISATVTVTMGFPKIGQFYFPGRSAVGNLIINDLGYPNEIVDEEAPAAFLPVAEMMGKLLPPRKPYGSKFDHGRAVCVCGSRGMTGSAALTTESSLKTGCGMTFLTAPSSVIGQLAGKLTEVVLKGMPESRNGTIAYEAYEALSEFIENTQALCIGPGLSHEEETSRVVRDLLATSRVPIILDADGINAFKGKAELLKKRNAPLLITPHAGEWKRLFGELPAGPTDILATLKRIAGEYEMTILYKGAPTMVAQPDGDAYVLPYGNSGMATAGSGDVLSGILVSLVAQGCCVEDAALLGAFIHGSAGDAAKKTKNEYSMVAGDIINHISVAINHLLPH
jgi:NAD(P)H-hydrate epimerase